MFRARKLRAIVVLVCVAATGMSACGGSDKPSAESPSTTVSSRASAADKAAAEAAALKISDLPTGWTTQPEEDDPEVPDVQAQLAKCLGVPVSELEDGPSDYESPDFENTEDNTVSNSVGYETSPAEAQKQFDLFADPKAPGCMTTAFKEVMDYVLTHPASSEDSVPEGVKVGTPQVGQMSFPKIGDRLIAYRVTLPITADEFTIKAYLDLIVAIKGRAGISMTFAGFNEPFPSDDAQHLMSLVVNRVNPDPQPA
jgi:hypothetical protein